MKSLFGTGSNLFIRSFVLCVLACGGYAVAQDSPAVDITGGGAKGQIPVFTGAHSIGPSIVKYGGGGIVVNGNVNTDDNFNATGNINANGNVNAGGQVIANGDISAAGYNLGTNAFAFGSYSNQNALLGFSGNSTMTGTGNTASGYQALLSDTTGSFNTATGGTALTANTSGHSNAATGYLALTANTTGFFNAGFGNRSLQENTTGNYNVGIGAYAGQTLDFNPLTGSNNTGVGAGSGFGSDSITNATAIGSNAVVSNSNALVLGCIAGVNNCGGAVNVGIGTAMPSNVFTIGQGAGEAIADSWDTYSSRKFKTNIQTLDGALAKVEQLRGVSYDLKATGKHEVGVIAEEVGEVVPEVVSWDKNGTDARGVDYGRLTALLIEATKEQQILIRQQQQQLEVQKEQIARLASKMRTLQASMKTGNRADSEIRTVKAQASVARE
jgi:hypothetical protein